MFKFWSPSLLFFFFFGTEHSDYAYSFPLVLHGVYQMKQFEWLIYHAK